MPRKKPQDGQRPPRRREELTVEDLEQRIEVVGGPLPDAFFDILADILIEYDERQQRGELPPLPANDKPADAPEPQRRRRPKQ